jgi:hypothetical protein
MFCTKCGSAIADGQQFCGACGTPVVIPVMLGAGNAQPAPPTAPAPPAPPAESPLAAPIAAIPPVDSTVAGLSRQRRPTAIVLIAALQLIIALLLAIATSGMFSFLMSGPGFRMTPAVIAVLAGLVLIVAAAGISAVGLMDLRPYGRAVALAFSCFGLLLFPVGTIVSIFVLRYLLKPETVALFQQAPAASDAKPEPWPMGMKLFAGFMVISMMALIALATMQRAPAPMGDAGTPGPQTLEMGILSEDGQSLVADADNLSGQDVAEVSLASTDSGMPEVAIRFTPTGSSKIERLSSSNLGRRMGFVVNGKLDTSQAAVIQSPLSEQESMTFPSQEEAERFVNGMNR